MKAADVLTQITNKEDVPFLKSEFLDVNMRLFRSADHYRHIILYICRDMKWLALSKFEDYTRPLGMSAANMGIPLNIICIVLGKGTNNPEAKIMINPHVLNHSQRRYRSLTNCGSIRLAKPILVERYGSVLVSYFDEDGKEHKDYFSSGTVQHEIDHNKGILITDREVK